MKNFLSTILAQIIPVMIGVYLGFALNNLGENQKMTEQAEVYRQMLKNEIQQNLEEVKRVNVYHLELTDNLVMLMRSETIVDDFRQFSFQGIQPGLVNNSAFNTGIQTGVIQQFDLELIQYLNKLYAYQRKYDSFNENAINAFLSQKFPETQSEISSAVRIMTMNMNDIKNFEAELTLFYTELLGML
jgi:hypothetical protein